MRPVGQVSTVAMLLLSLVSCRRAGPAPSVAARVSGEFAVAGLGAPVRIVRDRWGVPHIFAESLTDAFAAQGFVQAADRLFQMELWRRAAEGRLAETLGANFLDRDVMTRRLQYHGDRSAEWASYGPEAKRIADAFAAGVNAWVAVAREQRPELFEAAGWPVAFWSAEDLLNRTDAFDRDATIARADQQKLPPAVLEIVRRAAAPAFFTGLAAVVRLKPDATVDTTVRQMPDATLPMPSPYYLVHLHTPNWSAIGAAIPWRPGIVIGHDGNVVFARQDDRVRAEVRAVRGDSTASRSVTDVIAVKGRREPFVSTTHITPQGVVIATDRNAGIVYTLSWRGYEAGTAPAFAKPIESTRSLELAHLTGTVSFVHPLAITPAARSRFNVGPVPHGAAPPFFVRPDRNLWDATSAINAPGQSEDPDSPHHGDLAMLWSRGQSITLPFSEAAVAANAEATLTLVPAAHR